MSRSYGLRYGDEFVNARLWNQFEIVMDGTRGRRSLLVYRIITALIGELGISDCDDFTLVMSLERWACEQLTCDRASPKPKILDVRPSDAVREDPATVVPDIVEKTTATDPIPAAEPVIKAFDTSMFGGMNRNSTLSDIK